MIACDDDSHRIIRRWNAMDELDDDIDDRINDHLIRIADNNDDANDDDANDDNDDDNDNEYDPDHIIGDPDHIIECIVTSAKNSHHHEIYENENEDILAIDNGYSGVVLASSSSSSSDHRNREHAHERDNMVIPHNATSSSSHKCVLPRGRGMVPYDDDNRNDNGIEMLLLDNKINTPNRIVGWNDIHGIVSLPVVSKIGSKKQKQEKENDDGSSTIDRRMVAYDEDENGNEIIVSSSNNKCVLPRGRGMVPYVDENDTRNDNRRSVRGMVPSSGGKGDNNLNNERKGKQQQQRRIMVPIMSSYDDGQDHYPVDIDIDVDVGSDDVIPSRPPLPSLDDQYWNDENGHQWKVWNPLPLHYKSPNNANANNAKPAAKSFPFNPNAKTFTPSLGGATNNNPALPQQDPPTKPILTPPPPPPPPVVATTTSTKKKSSININNSNSNSNDKSKNKNDKNTIGVIVKRSNLNKSRQAKANHQNKENNNNNSNNISSKNNSNSNKNKNNRIGVIVKRSNLKKDRQRNSSSSSRSNSNSYISINNDIATTTSTSTSGGDDDVVVDDSNNHSNNNNNNTTTTPTSNNNNTVSPSNSIYSSTNFDLDSDEEDNTEDNDDDDVLLDDDINDNIDASRYTRSIHSMPVLEEVTEEESPLHSSSVKNSNKKSSDKYCHPFSSSSSPSSSSSLGGGSSASEIVPTTSASSKGSSIANNNTGGSGDVDDEAFFQSQREQVSAAAARVGGLLLCVETVSTHSQSENDNGSDSSQYIKINDVEKGMMVTCWNDKKNGRQLLKDDDDNDDDVEREGKPRIPIVTPWFLRKDFITIALIILIGIIVGCIAFLTLYLTVVEGGKNENLGLISSEESESSAEESSSSSSSSNNGEFVSPWSDASPPIDTTIDNGSNVDTDEDFGITTTVSTIASEEGRDNDNTSGTSTHVVVEEATNTSSSTSTPIDNDSNVDTDEDFGITTTVLTTTPSDEEGRDNDKTSGTSTPVIVVVEEATTTTASSPTPSPIQQIVPSQQPVIVATDTITDSSTPSTTTNGNINGGDNNNSNHSTNNSRLIPVIKDTDAIQDIIKKVRRQIELLIFDDDTLIGSFLRLVFHDCVGGCDGCIDLTNPENNGLDIPINTLQPIVDEFTNVITTESSSSSSNLLSRTDIWMLSSLVATEIALPFLNNDLLFPLHWIGRQTCEQKYSDQIEESVLGFCGLDFFGTPTKCESTLGPHIDQPHGSLGTQSIQDFFEEEFNFNPQQITALMGAHSVGRMHRHNSGFDGTWDLSAGSLDGGYWLELIGDPPDYFLESINNNDLPEIPDRKQWRAIINHGETDTATVAAEQKEQKTIAMLNVDIALVKNVLDMDETTGDVGCGEVNNQNLNDCSDETPFWPFANVYNGNNRKFLTDFRDVLNHLIDHGYNDLKPLGRKTVCPNGRVCTFGFTHSNDPKTTDSSETVDIAIVEELSPPPTPSPSRSPPRMIPWVTNGPKIGIDRLCYDTVGENLVVTYNLFLEKQDRSVTDITIQVFDMNNIEIVMLENEKEQDIILNPRVSNDPLLSSLSCGEETCHTWTSRGGLQMSTTNLIGNGQDYGVLLLANTATTTDDAANNINDNNSRLEILAGVSFRLGGCNE